MTVRAWFTISAVALAVLGVAFAVRFVQPTKPPEILASVGAVRLEGVPLGSCWPQPRGVRRCQGASSSRADTPRVPRSGVLRVVADYPVQPPEGTLRIEPLAGGDAVLEVPWDDTVRYELQPGSYVLRADARYPPAGYVRYAFGLRVR